MAKKVVGEIRLQLPAGAANPAPPVGPALGAKGVNIMAFCKEFNAKTKDQAGMILPVIISVYQDKSFTFILKSPPASVLLKKAAKIESGSKVPNRDKVGKVTKKQLLEIVELKKKDLNAINPDNAARMIAGAGRWRAPEDDSAAAQSSSTRPVASRSVAEVTTTPCAGFSTVSVKGTVGSTQWRCSPTSMSRPSMRST